MSPRRTRAATVEQSAVSTRSRRLKINNVSQDITKSAQKVRQLQKKTKSASAKKNLKVTAKRNTSKSPNAEITLKNSAKKRTTRRKLYLDKDADTTIEQEDQNKDINDSIRMLINRHCDNIAKVELVKTDLLELNISKDPEKVSNGKLQWKISTTNAKTSPIIVTPKSTPPKLSLTPHRSKKTPKKSPISLGSPKTHSLAVPKLFKSPRKLSLTDTNEDSKKNLEKSNSDSHSKKSQKRKRNSPGNSPMSDKSASASPTAKNKRKKSANLTVTARKFSKSPKIVLKSPKSKKSKSRKLMLLSPSKMKHSTSPTSSGSMPKLKNAKLSRISAKDFPLPKGKNLSLIKYRFLNPKLTEILTASQIKDLLAEPVVLLEKVSLESLKQKYKRSLKEVISNIRSDTLVKVKSPSNRARSNSKVSIQNNHVSVSPEQNSSTKLRNSSMEKPQINNTNRTSPRIKYNSSIQEKDGLPLLSSTPREEKMTLKNNSLSNTPTESVNNMSSNIRLRHRNQSNIQLPSTVDNDTSIENVSRLSLIDKEISDTSQSRLSNGKRRDATYDKDNTMEKQENNTYELEQPQTLNLRQMINHTSTDMNLSLKDNIKKPKVRFADVTSEDSDSVQKSVDNKLNGSQSSISHNDSLQHRNNVMSSRKLKKEPLKFFQSSILSPFKRLSPRMHEGTPRAQFQVTPKTFASVEKKSEKKSSMKKKVPNFEKIHEQMFAKSESLVDAKKRLKARHLAFTANKPVLKDGKTEEKKLLPTDTRDGIHNRFGFKLKKPEATHIILKKQTVFSREKQQNETRMVLKGVRTNRRFELQMKARNLNS